MPGGIPDYFGENLQQQPQQTAIAMPSQPSQAVQPIGGAPPMPYANDAQTQGAMAVQEASPDIQEMRRIGKKLSFAQREADTALGKISDNRSENEKILDKMIADPGVQRLLTHVAWHGAQRRESLVQYMKFLGDHVETGDKNKIDAMKTYLGAAGNMTDLRKQMVDQQKNVEADAARADSLALRQRIEDNRDRSRKILDRVREYKLAADKETDPIKRRNLEGLADLHQMQANILSSYGPDEAAAKLAALEQEPWAKAMNAFSAYANATGTDQSGAVGQLAPHVMPQQRPVQHFRRPQPKQFSFAAAMPGDTNMVVPPPPNEAGANTQPGGQDTGASTAGKFVLSNEPSPKAVAAKAGAESLANERNATAAGKDAELLKRATSNARREGKPVDEWLASLKPGSAQHTVYKRLISQGAAPAPQANTNRGGGQGVQRVEPQQALSNFIAKYGRKPTLAELKKELGG